MPRAIFLSWVPMMLFEVVALACVVVPGADTSREALLVLEQAARSAPERLTSGEGIATVQIHDGESVLLEDYSVHVRFMGDMYHLDFTYREMKPPRLFYDRRVVVCNGEALFVVRFSDRIKPSGCETEVYPLRGGTLAIATSGFEWPPNQLHKEIFNLSLVMEMYSVEVDKLANGSYRGRYNIGGKIDCVFEAGPESGFHVTSFRGYRNSPRRLSAEQTARWKVQDGVWYVEAVEEKAYRDGVLLQRKKIEYQEFSVNPALPPELFSLDGLQMCSGSRIIDRRPDAKVRYYNYRNTDGSDGDGDGDAAVGGNDHSERQGVSVDMIAELESLPPRSPPPQEDSGGSSTIVLWAIFIGANVVALALAAIVWWRWPRLFKRR